MEVLLQSKGQQNRLLSGGGVALGLLCVYMANHAAASSLHSEKARWLGYILMGFGALGILFSEDVLIEMDREKKMISVSRKNIFGETKRLYSANQISHVRVYSAGRANSPRSFSINLGLKNGQEIKTGKWSFDKEDIHQEALRLSEVFACPVINPSKQGFQITLPVQIGLAAGLAIAVYPIWYLLKVGPWCLAMWQGNAPFIITGGVFLTVFLALHFSSKATNREN